MVQTKGTADTSLVKSAHQELAYTDEQIRELAKCSDPVTGPLYFMENYMMIQHPTRGSIKFKPYDYQIDLINNYVNYRHSINMMGRQMGKTTCAAGYLLWYAMFVPDSFILIASYIGDSAQDIMDRVRYAYEECPDYIRAGTTEYNKTRITFDNGSRMTSSTTTEKTGRGKSISIVYLDEFAFVAPNIAKEFWTALRPTLATGGKCIITSTPNNDDDQFATIWRSALNTFDEYGNATDLGSNGFKGFLAVWKQHPDRDEEWAREERDAIGEDRFRREHNCEFIIFDETLVDALKLVSMHGTDPIRNMGKVRWYKHPHPSFSYVVSLDPCLGTGGDNAAIQVLELPSMIQVAEWQHNKTAVEGQMQVMMDILIHLEEMQAQHIYWSVENNTLGEAALVVIRETGEENFPGEMLHEPQTSGRSKRIGRRGFTTTNKSKLESCVILKRWIESDTIHLQSKPTISELKNFVAKGASFKAKSGETDDLVMALVLAVRMINHIATYEDDVYDVVSANLSGAYDNEPSSLETEWDEPFPMSF